MTIEVFPGVWCWLWLNWSLIWPHRNFDSMCNWNSVEIYRKFMKNSHRCSRSLKQFYVLSCFAIKSNFMSHVSRRRVEAGASHAERTTTTSWLTLSFFSSLNLISCYTENWLSFSTQDTIVSRLTASLQSFWEYLDEMNSKLSFFHSGHTQADWESHNGSTNISLGEIPSFQKIWRTSNSHWGLSSSVAILLVLCVRILFRIQCESSSWIDN